MPGGCTWLDAVTIHCTQVAQQTSDAEFKNTMENQAAGQNIQHPAGLFFCLLQSK